MNMMESLHGTECVTVVGRTDLALLSRDLVMERKTTPCALLPSWTVTVGESPVQGAEFCPGRSGIKDFRVLKR